MRRNSFDVARLPILRPLETREFRDAPGRRGPIGWSVITSKPRRRNPVNLLSRLSVR